MLEELLGGVEVLLTCIGNHLKGAQSLTPRHPHRAVQQHGPGVTQHYQVSGAPWWSRMFNRAAVQADVCWCTALVTP
jgi:hypothetical protein